MVRIKIYGARGSGAIYDPNCVEFGINTTCYGIWTKNELIALDAGSGWIIAQDDISKRKPKAITVAISHTHHDHIEGLLIAGSMHLEGIPKATLVGSPYLLLGLNNRFGPGNSPIPFKALRNIQGIAELLERESTKTSHGTKIQPFTAGYHPVVLDPKQTKSHYRTFHENYGVYGYIILVEGKKIAYATDMEFDFKRPGNATPSGDREKRFESYIENISSADVLIADAQYTSQEYAGGTSGYGHSYHEQILWLAQRAGVKRLVITHHEPRKSDTKLAEVEKELQEKAKGLEVILAREGQEIELRGCKK